MMPLLPIQDQLSRWLRHLGTERRLSALSLDAYGRDVRQFGEFLSSHPHMHLKKLSAADLRMFMAQRRAAGIGSRSLMRQFVLFCAIWRVRVS